MRGGSWPSHGPRRGQQQAGGACVAYGGMGTRRIGQGRAPGRQSWRALGAGCPVKGGLRSVSRVSHDAGGMVLLAFTVGHRAMTARTLGCRVVEWLRGGGRARLGGGRAGVRTGVLGLSDGGRRRAGRGASGLRRRGCSAGSSWHSFVGGEAHLMSSNIGWGLRRVLLGIKRRPRSQQRAAHRCIPQQYVAVHTESHVVV